MIKNYQFNSEDKLQEGFPPSHISLENGSSHKIIDFSSLAEEDYNSDPGASKQFQRITNHQEAHPNGYNHSNTTYPLRNQDFDNSNNNSDQPYLHRVEPRTTNKLLSTTSKLFKEAKNILNKSYEIRSPADNQILLQLPQYNEFLSKLIIKVGVQCFKGLMKQAKIEEVNQRQMICEQGVPITHIIILLDGKLGICKQEDDFVINIQGIRSPRTPITPAWKINAMAESAFLPTKTESKEKQTKTINTIIRTENIFDELIILSCRQIEGLRKKNSLLRKKSYVPTSTGLYLPAPFTKQEFETYQIENYVNPGEQYGSKIRCKTKIHSNTCFAVEKSTLLIIEFNILIYWFEYSYREKLSQSIEKLKKIPAFSFLEDPKLMECILQMKKETKKRNDYIFKQGSLPDKLYILLSGQVKISKQARLFEQNPNQLYVDRRKLMQKGPEAKNKQDYNKKIDILPYANLTSLYNYRPMKKIIELGIITSNNSFSLIGEEELIQKRYRQTNVQVISLDCEYYEIQIKKLQDILGSKFIEDFYRIMEKSLKKVILYRQNQYAGKVNLENRQNLDYFYYEDNKIKESPRKYKLEKINNKFNDLQQNSPIHFKSSQHNNSIKDIFEDTSMKPYYTTFNFHKLIQTQRSRHVRKRSEKQGRATSLKNRKDSEDSQEGKTKFDPVQQRLIDISHTWKPIKKKVIQEIKVMQKISKKRHSININQPLIEQKYFKEVEKQQKRISREHKIFKLSLGKRINW